MRVIIALLSLVVTCHAHAQKIDPSKWPGCIGSWRFDGATYTDASFQGRNGSAVGGVTLTNGTSFTGMRPAVGGYAATASTTHPASSMTIAAWMKCNWGTAAFRPILSQGYGANAGIGFLTTGGAFNGWGTKELLLVGSGYDQSNGGRASASYGALANDTWHHVAGTITPTSQTIWIDGVSQTLLLSTNGSVDLVSAAIQIGGASGTGDTFSDGALDEVYLFDRALTATEIYQLFTSTHP